jgi:LCP family protein required for cell wall assembly
MSAAGATTFVVYHKLNGNITEDDLTGKLGGDRPAVIPANADGRPLNILLIGSDTRAGDNRKFGGGRDTGPRSDTTILLHIAADRKRATALSFPRDTMLQIPSCVLPSGERSRPQLNMFNSAFHDGGTACTVLTVEELTDIRIDHHLVIDFKGFAKMVDAIDGVPVCLPGAVNDEKHSIHLRGGRRPVHGREALDYVRLRYDGSIGGKGSDLDRIKRQQAFLSALATKVKSTGVLLNPARLLGLLDAATKSITTDPGLSSVRKLAELAQSLRGLDTKNITFVTTPVHTYAPDPNRLEVTQPAADELFRAVKFGEPLTKPAAPEAAGAGPAGKPPVPAVTVPPSQVRPGTQRQRHARNGQEGRGRAAAPGLPGDRLRQG